MARRLINIPKSEEDILNEEESKDADGGGASGIPGAGFPVVAGPIPQREEIDVPVKSYRVIATKRVSYDGAQVILNANKVISEHVYNIDLLLRQGVQLEELG